MRHLYLFCFVILANSSCLKAQHNPVPARTITDVYIQDFKMNFLVSCLTKSYANPCFDEEMLTESSYYKDFLLGADNYQLVDSLADMVVAQINLDSIKNAQFIISPQSTLEEIENARSEGVLGKRTLYSCLRYYLSEELDRIAKERFEK